MLRRTTLRRRRDAVKRCPEQTSGIKLCYKVMPARSPCFTLPSIPAAAMPAAPTAHCCHAWCPSKPASPLNTAAAMPAAPLHSCCCHACCPSKPPESPGPPGGAPHGIPGALLHSDDAATALADNRNYNYHHSTRRLPQPTAASTFAAASESTTANIALPCDARSSQPIPMMAACPSSGQCPLFHRSEPCCLRNTNGQPRKI